MFRINEMALRALWLKTRQLRMSHDEYLYENTRQNIWLSRYDILSIKSFVKYTEIANSPKRLIRILDEGNYVRSIYFIGRK